MQREALARDKGVMYDLICLLYFVCTGGFYVKFVINQIVAILECYLNEYNYYNITTISQENGVVIFYFSLASIEQT